MLQHLGPFNQYWTCSLWSKALKECSKEQTIAIRMRGNRILWVVLIAIWFMSSSSCVISFGRAFHTATKINPRTINPRTISLRAEPL